MIGKLIAVLLLIALVVGVFFALPDFGSSTAIETSDDLSNMELTGNYHLANDIDLTGKNWESINFNGKLDGCGYSIIGLSKPLFNELDASVSNLKLVDVNIKGSKVGSLAVTIHNRGSEYIDGIFCSGTIATTGSDYCGGLSAYCYCNLSNCTSSVNISGEAPAGGLCGYYRGNAENCTNEGNIFSSSDKVGGLFSDIGHGSIKSCTNTGDVISKGSQVGGLFGIFSQYSTKPGLAELVGNTVKNCKIQGKQHIGGITGDLKGISFSNFTAENVELIGDMYVGGISGTLMGYSGKSISGNHVSGSIKNLSTQMRSESYVGGFAGETDLKELTNCSSDMDITLTNGGNYVGGLFGKCGPITMSNVSNRGDISCKGEMVGGLIGYINISATDRTMSDCWNEGNITSSSNYVGGLIGLLHANQVPTGKLTLKSCYNEGNISGNGYVGGIEGAASATYNDGLSNNGKITGSHHIGGIAGYGGGYSNCQNTASITATGVNSEGGSYVGGIVGESKKWSILDNYVTNCNNDGTVTSEKNGAMYVGGICGYGNGINRNMSFLVNSANISSHGDYTGGLIGYTSMPSTDKTLTDSQNTGNVKSTSNFVGGLIGCTGKAAVIAGNLQIDSSSSTGQVSGYDYVGGYVGGGSAKIKNAINIMNITGNTFVGGIAGQACSVSYCSNSGNITANGSNNHGHSFAGGIAGQIYGPDNMVELTNSGKVSGKSDYVGGLFGECYNAANNPTLSKSSNTNSSIKVGVNVGGLIGFVSTLFVELTVKDCKDVTGVMVGGGQYIIQ